MARVMLAQHSPGLSSSPVSRLLTVTLDEHLSPLLFRVSDLRGLVCYRSTGPCAEERVVRIMAYVRWISGVLGQRDTCVADRGVGLVTEPDSVETGRDCSVGDTGGVE